MCDKGTGYVPRQEFTKLFKLFVSYKTIRERCFGLCASIKWSTQNATGIWHITLHPKKMVDSNKTNANVEHRPPLWSSGQSFWLQIQRSRVRFPALPDFLSGSGSGTGYTQPREVN